MKTTNPISSAIPPFSSAPSTSAVVGVTLKAIMVELQQMEADFGGCLDYFTDEMCQMNTRCCFFSLFIHMFLYVCNPYFYFTHDALMSFV